MTEEKKVNIEEQLEEEKVDEALLALLASYTPENFTLGQGTYKLVKNYRDGFDYEATIKRYNDVLDKYDYIVGDWGYDQLRLKGFFMDDFKSAPIDAKISTLEDYLYEYCNFGCAYFVIQQTGEFKRRGRTSSSSKKSNSANKPNNRQTNKPNSKSTNKNKNKAHTDEKRYNQNKKKPTFKSNRKGSANANKKAATENKKPTKEKVVSKASGKHQFTIRKKEEE